MWTGVTGTHNGVAGNWQWPSPASDHSRLERISAFPSTALQREPIWVIAARAGLSASTLHATGSAPFHPHLDRLDPAGRSRLVMMSGYEGYGLGPRVFDELSTPPRRARDWDSPPTSARAPLELSFEVGDRTFEALIWDDPEYPVVGMDTLGVRGGKDGPWLALLHPGADGAFSTPLPTSTPAGPLTVALRLFELAPDGTRFLLLASGAGQLLAHPRGILPSSSPFARNGDWKSYVAEVFGAPRWAGGDSVAEARFLETLGLLQEQISAQSASLLGPDPLPDLAVLYTPILDDAAHVWGGFLDDDLATHDTAVAASLWEAMAAAWELADGWLGQLLERAAHSGADLLLVSDHGIEGSDRVVNVNVALRRTGLLRVAEDGTIDLRHTRALMPPLDDCRVAVNTVGRAGGIVPRDQVEVVRAELDRALLALRDPETGASLVRRLIPTPPSLGPDGAPSSAELFVELAPGYYPSDRLDVDVLVSSTRPQGRHVSPPERPRMRALLAAWGPSFPPGEPLEGAQALDIAPTVLDILRVERPPGLPGRSLVARRNESAEVASPPSSPASQNR